MHYIDTLPNDASHLHTSRYTLRWSDMDAFGHVNNAMYFTYFEQVRVDWLRTMAVGHELVLANVSCTFFKPLTFPADIEVALYAGRAGRSSLDSFYQIRTPGGPDELSAFGHGTIVWFDHAAGHSVAIPETVRRQLAEAS
jgi:acyl-CoA thioester hydrolase